MIDRIRLERLPTGVPGLDEVLGGGIPEYSLNLVTGGPGTGKTTLVHQIAFANGTADRPALFFTVMGEPTIKLLRYQQQFSFFDPRRVGTDVRILNLSDEVASGKPEVVLDRIIAEVEAAHPRIVAVDSFPSVFPDRPVRRSLDFEVFTQRLAMQLTSWEVTAFLIGGEVEPVVRGQVLTIADGIISLSQVVRRNSMVRKLQIVKQRGIAARTGLHTVRISGDGIEVFPRTLAAAVPAVAVGLQERRCFGIPDLDGMLGGGIPAGDAVVVAGATGTGKTTLATRFVMDGAAKGERSVIVLFEERPPAYLARARALGLPALLDAGIVRVLYLEPLDLSVDEIVHALRRALLETNATRVVIDSLSGFELALAADFREDFRESLYRLVEPITAAGVTVLMTIETVTGPGDMRVLPEAVSFLADDLLVLRRLVVDGELCTALAVVKMRGSDHSRVLREVRTTGRTIVMGRQLRGYLGLLSGEARRRTHEMEPPTGLSSTEGEVLAAFHRLGVATLTDLAPELPLSPAELQDAIARLLALDYIAHDAGVPGEAWRAVGQSHDEPG